VKARTILLPALLLLVLLGAWELYARLGPLDPLILPAPDQIASSLWHDRGLLWDNLAVTGREVLLGILVSVVAGVGCAIAIHLSATLRRGEACTGGATERATSYACSRISGIAVVSHRLPRRSVPIA